MCRQRAESWPRRRGSLSLRDVLAFGPSYSSLARAARLHAGTRGGRPQSRAEPGPERGGGRRVLPVLSGAGTQGAWEEPGPRHGPLASRQALGSPEMRRGPTWGPCCGARPGGSVRSVSDAAAATPWPPHPGFPPPLLRARPAGPAAACMAASGRGSGLALDGAGPQSTVARPQAEARCIAGAVLQLRMVVGRCGPARGHFSPGSRHPRHSEACVRVSCLSEGFGLRGEWDLALLSRG